jgi:hypothetical protein
MPAMTGEVESPGRSEARGKSRRSSLLQAGIKKLRGPGRDEVDCTVFSPPEVGVRESFLVQVFAHIPAKAAEARGLAEEFDPEAKRLGVTSLATEIDRGSKLTFELLMRELTVHDPVQELIWRGRSQSVQFEVTAPAGFRPQVFTGKVLISQDTVPVGRIGFKLRVVEDTAVAEKQSAPRGEAERYRTAFISYASKDRQEVLKRVQMLTATGIDFFQDVLDLDPGDRWEKKLYERIDESDVLFLFWSTAARESEWVRREWQYGLERKGEDFICPVIIEGPPPPEPPPELTHIHFSDKVLYFMSPT